MHHWKSSISSHKLDVHKQTSVSHSSTESEFISLDAGLRIDGDPDLDLWDVGIEVLHSFHNNTPPTRNNSANKGRAQRAAGNCLRISNVRLRREGNQNVKQLSNLDHVATNANSSLCKAHLYIFEDNEAVIKLIIKGQKSCDETRVPNPQSCVGLVV